MKVKNLCVEVALRLAAIDIRWFGRCDGEYYLQANKDVALSGEDPIRHFLLHGNQEGRKLFPEDGEHTESTDRLHNLIFFKLYHRVLRLVHARLNDEQWENIRIIKESGLFDTRYYLENNKDVLESNVDPLIHFVSYGYKEGRNPCPSFDTIRYAIQQGIPSYSNVNPFVHYILHSDTLNRYPDAVKDDEMPDHSIPFDANYYLKKYPDLEQANIDALEHFRTHGIYEGRDSDPSFGGYSQWRQSFVNQPRQIQHSASDDPESTELTICLIHEGQNQEEIQRTVDSLETQGERFSLAVVGDSSTAKLVLGQVNASDTLKTSEVKSLPAVSRLFEDTAKTTGFISFLYAGDQLMQGAITAVKNAIHSHPHAQLHYSDEEIVDISDLLIKPVFKGKFDPDLQSGKDYIGNFLTLSTSLAGITSGLSQQSWAVSRFLMVNRSLNQLSHKSVNHIPHILYRKNKPDDWPKSQHMAVSHLVKDTLKTRLPSLSSVQSEHDGSFRLKYSVPDSGAGVSIIIPTRNGIEVLKPCIESIQNKSKFTDIELIIVDNGSDEISAIDYLEQLATDHPNVVVIEHDEPFNYSELNNLGVKAASGEFLVFLNNDIEVISDDWLDELISHAARPEIGVVAPLLLYPDGTIQHAGVVLGVGGVAAHAFSGWDPESREFEQYNHVRRVSAVTGACMAMRRDVFDAVGGFDEANVPVDFNDVDLCLRVGEAGLAVLFTPCVKLYHYESKTRTIHEDNATEAERFALEVQWMQERWFAAISNDPYYSLNYNLGLPGYDLSWPPRDLNRSKDNTEVPILDPYVTHSNIDRAETIVKTMGQTPHSLSRLTHDVDKRIPGLSVIILNLDKPEFIVPLINSMKNAKSYFSEKGFDFEILIGDTGSTDPQVLEMFESAPPFVKILSDLEYQFSRCNNEVFARLSKCDTVLFLNNDIEFCGDAPGTLFNMFEFLHHTADAGVVGAQLLFPDKTIQHAGIDVFETGQMKGFVYHPDTKNQAFGDDIFPRNMWAVTGACLMLKAADFVAVNGFDEDYRTECQDAALCLELRRRGLSSYVLSPGEILHYENGTRPKGSEDWPDRQRFMRHWSGWIDMELRDTAS